MYSNGLIDIIIVRMQGVTIEGIITNYKLLGDPDMQIRERANLYLIGLIDHQEVWKITQEMIVHSQNPDYQLLGAQILYQKVQRDLDELQTNERLELKSFIFGQLVNQSLTLPTIRKLGSSGALIAISLILDQWPTFLTDMVAFMEGSALQLRNGLVVFERIPDELKNSYRVKHGQKMLIRDKLFDQGDLLYRVYSSAIILNQETLTNISLQGLENWIVIGFPLLKYVDLVNLLLGVMNSNELCFENCCRIIKEGLLHAAREKYQSISDAEFSIQRQKYSKEEMQSLSIILNFLQGSKTGIYQAIELGNNAEQIEIYTSIIKQILLSYGFLLKEDLGYELIEMMFKVVSSEDLKLSYSTFEFWIDFCEKLLKMKVDESLALKFWQVIEHLFDIIVSKTILDMQTLMTEMLKDQDTIDDLTKINISEYRKEAQNLIKFTFDYFSAKKQKEGSLLFFKKMLTLVENQKKKGEVLIGLESSIYLVKSALESMVRQYDTTNIIEFIQFVMREIDCLSTMPPRFVAEVLNLIKDCNRQIKEVDTLFIKCLAFCLKHVAEDEVSHYAVYAFQSLMESINQLGNDSLVNDLMIFYSSMNFTKDSILEKVLEGILTVITKLTNRQAIEHYLMRIVSGVQTRYSQLQAGQGNASNYVSLIEIKTLLDSFDHFKGADQEYFRKVFLKISSYGLGITTNIIQTYLSQRKKFTTVGDLGASMSVIRNSLRICENSQIPDIPFKHYINLMNIVMTIFTPSHNMFNEYSSLTDILVKVFTQFVGEQVADLNNWLQTALPCINSFFQQQIQRHTIKSIDPDFLRCYFSILEAFIIYNKDLYLAQPEHEKIYDLVIHSIQHINQVNFQRKAINLLYQCVQMRDSYQNKTEYSIKTIFASIPHISSICQTNLGRIVVILMENLDLKGKENAVRQLLEYQPYTAVNKDIKQIIAKLFAFTVETKIDRYIKGTFHDLNEVRWKQAGSDLALHLELRYTKWKREYQQMAKSGKIPN